MKLKAYKTFVIVYLKSSLKNKLKITGMNPRSDYRALPDNFLSLMPYILI